MLHTDHFQALRLATLRDGLPGPCKYWVCLHIPPSDTTNSVDSNAKTGGLAKDFDLTSNQYSIILLVFFVSYVVFEIPSNMLIARARPSLYLSGIAIIWGIVAASMAATKDWKQLTAIRFVLGFVESGFAPGVAFYLSSWFVPRLDRSAS
jgi:MFS family permease